MSRIEALMATTEFESLLDRLASYIAAETEKTPFLIDHEVLSNIVGMTGELYDGTQFSADLVSKSTFHELKALLPRIMQLLTHGANYSNVLVSLGAPVTLALSPDQAAVKHAVEWHETIVRGLAAIERAAPPPPKHPAHRPAKTKDLRFVVGWLVHWWEGTTGHSFKQNWHKGEPLTNATRFVHDVVKLIAPERLGELPKVTERIVKDWCAGERDSWWRDVADDRSLTTPTATSGN